MSIDVAASRSAAATSIDMCTPSRTTQRPPTMTSRTSAALAQKTAAAAGVPASRTESSEIVVTSARAPAAIRPPSGRPRLA